MLAPESVDPTSQAPVDLNQSSGFKLGVSEGGLREERYQAMEQGPEVEGAVPRRAQAVQGHPQLHPTLRLIFQPSQPRATSPTLFGTLLHTLIAPMLA